MTYGARDEPTLAWHETNGRAAQWFQEDYDNNVRSTMFPLAPRGEVFPGDPTFVGKDGAEYQWSNVSPSVGFAWDITGDGKTSLRGGGLFYDQHRDGEYENQIVDNQPWQSRITLTNPTETFSNPYLGRSAEVGLVSLNNVPLRTDTPCMTPINVTTHGPVYRTPVTYNYNLTFERDLGHSVSARAAYVGSTNKCQRSSIQLNPLDQALYTARVQLPTFTDARHRYASIVGSISQEVQNRSSKYNSLQTSASKRFSGGFQITGNYTLSKVMGNVRGDLSPFYVGNDLTGPLMWGPLGQDRRHRSTMSWLWSLSGAKMSGPARYILGDWLWRGIIQCESRSPLTITSGTDRSRTGINADRAKYTGVSADLPAGSPNTAWFNPAAFAVADWGTIGQTKPGELYGPGSMTYDIGLFRNFRMGGDKNFQFGLKFVFELAGNEQG